MSVKLACREKRGVTIVDAGGKLTLGEGTCVFREKLHELIESGARRILLNLADVTYIDSSGIGELVAAYSAVTRAGGQIKLLNLGVRTRDILMLTRLCTVFETFDDERAAVHSFPAPPLTDLQLRWANFMHRITRRSPPAERTAFAPDKPVACAVQKEIPRQV